METTYNYKIDAAVFTIPPFFPITISKITPLLGHCFLILVERKNQQEIDIAQLHGYATLRTSPNIMVPIG
ncbi:MAG: hypothetical protein LEGION0398_MBIBDBAK_00116 [Legionellaceae bacterium]